MSDDLRSVFKEWWSSFVKDSDNIPQELLDILAGIATVAWCEAVTATRLDEREACAIEAWRKCVELGIDAASRHQITQAIRGTA